MTISVTIKNEDSRQNAVIEILETNNYAPVHPDGTPEITRRFTDTRGLLRGGESKTVYVTSTSRLEIIERQNG